jgi:hypothetical protein
LGRAAIFIIAARFLLHGEHWAETKKSTSAADAENAFICYQSVSISARRIAVRFVARPDPSKS